MMQPQHLPLAEGDLTIWRPAGAERLSRTDFWRLVDAYARRIEADPRVGDFGLIIDRTSAEMMALFIAFICTDRRVSFFPPSSARQDPAYYREQQNAAIGRIAPSSILAFEDGSADSLEGIDGLGSAAIIALPRLSAGDAEVAGASAEQGLAAFRAALEDRDRTLFWQHSSGTTGIKKAVGVTSTMLLGQYQSYWPQVRSLAHGDVRVASWLPLYHDMGLLATFLLPLLGGAAIAIQDPFDWVEQPGLLFDMIEAERSTICWMPNFAYRHLTRLRPVLPERDLASVRAWTSCSEPCRYPDAVAFETAFAARGVRPGSVVGCYAMAETVFAVSQCAVAEQRALIVPVSVDLGVALGEVGATVVQAMPEQVASDWQAVLSSGRPVPGLEWTVLVDGKPVAAEGVYGELAVRAPFLFAGYRAMDRAASNIGSDGFFATGDLGCVLDGHVYVFGRTKELVIVNGKNIYVGDVEDRLSQIEGVRPGRVVVFGCDNPRTGSEDLIVVAEKSGRADVDDAALERAISAAVSASFLVTPFDVRLVSDRWLVKSTSGKISRQSNRAKYQQEFA